MPSADVVEMIEKSTHGGYSTVLARRAVATRYTDPCFITDNGQRKRVMSTIEAADENNQYGHKMCDRLCRGGFTRINKDPYQMLTMVDKLVEKQNCRDNPKSYMFCVDMELTDVLHESNEEIYPRFSVET